MNMSPCPTRWDLTLLFLSISFPASFAQNGNRSLPDLLPELQDLGKFSAPSNACGSRQNTTFCSLQAVNHALNFEHGNLRYNANQSDIKISGISKAFNLSAANGEFPCKAQYVSSDYNGAPEVQITHAYCESTCGKSWERSQSLRSGEWVSAFVGFIIPTIVSCECIAKSL